MGVGSTLPRPPSRARQHGTGEFRHTANSPPPGFDVTGVDAAMQRLRATLQDYTAFRSELSGLIAEDDMVAVRITHRTKVRPHTFRSRAGEVRVGKEQALRWTAIVPVRLHDRRLAQQWV